MIRLTKRLVFAVEAVLDVAYHGGAGPVQSADVSARQGIPRRYLEPVMQQLVRQGVLNGVRGPRGGYTLAREKRRVTIGDVVRVVTAMDGAEDPLAETEGSELGRLAVRPLCMEMQAFCMTQFDSVTFEDLCDKAREAGAEPPGPPEDAENFSI